MSWSPQQEAALKDVGAWLADPDGAQVYRVFGYAGTGKASLVLRKKGCEDASTIHSLIYTVVVNERTGDAEFVLNEESDLVGAGLLVVDEVSMVGEELARDLLSFGTRILVLGDPAQLPPVKDEGFFIQGKPDVMLTEVHRQAADNPIIRMSMDIRAGQRLRPGSYGDSLVASSRQIGRDRLGELVMGADQLLCGLNRTRTSYNRRMRAMKGLVGADKPWHPTIGDRLICLRNKRDKHLFNGALWEVESVDNLGGKLAMIVNSLDEERDPVKIEVFEEFFNGTEQTLDWKAKRGTEEFTFGWAMTCHKSQGSQWDNVIIFDESSAFREAQKNWLYTAVTRAAERVTIVI